MRAILLVGVSVAYLAGAARAGTLGVGSLSATAASIGAVAATGGAMTGPLKLGTGAKPMLLSTAPSQDGFGVNVVSPGTPGTPGPGTAHHGGNFTCTKAGFYGASPAVGEMDCINIVARQDGLGAGGADGGDLGGILADVQSTLRAQNFTALLESHSSVVDTRSNTLPYFLDLQVGAINTAGYPSDDGTVSRVNQMNAFFAALIDGHGTGITLVEQPDTSANAGKLGQGVIDNVISASHYNQATKATVPFYNVDGSGNTTAPTGNLSLGAMNGTTPTGGVINTPFLRAGQDGSNGNIGIGNTALTASTPYVDFDGWKTSHNIRLINSALNEISILQTNGAALAVLNANALTVPGDMKIGNSKALWLQNGQTATCYLAMSAAGTISCNDSQGDNWQFGTVSAVSIRSAGGVVTTQTGAYTLAASDCGTTIRDTGTSAHTDTVPSGLPLGCQIDVIQAGSGGTITFAAGSGETLEQFGSGTLSHTTAGQFAKATVKIDSASTFLLGGQVQ